MDAWIVLGIMAGALTSSGYLPQIIKGWRSKKMTDVSLLMPTVLGLGMLLWLIYGIHKEDVAIILANIAGCSLTATLVAMKLHYDRHSVASVST